MNAHLKLTERGAKLIQHFEGCLKKEGDKFRAYHCPANVLTIGWGHTNHHGRKFDAASRWTSDECHQVFLEDMEGFEKAVRRLVKVPLTDYQYDSLVSLCYNIGEGNLAKSTLLRKVNAKDFAGAAAEFKRWNKGGGKTLPGLTRRRASEALLFQGLPDENYDGKADLNASPYPMAQAVDDPED
jgi:lysozyme